MVNFFRESEDEEFWDSDRDSKWAEIEDEAEAAGISRGEWEHSENVKDYGDYDYDEDGNEI